MDKPIDKKIHSLALIKYNTSPHSGSTECKVAFKRGYNAGNRDREEWLGSKVDEIVGLMVEVENEILTSDVHYDCDKFSEELKKVLEIS